MIIVIAPILLTTWFVNSQKDTNDENDENFKSESSIKSDKLDIDESYIDTDGKYISNSLNIEFTIPAGWKEVRLDELSYFPQYFSEPKIIIKNEEKINYYYMCHFKFDYCFYLL